MLYIFLYFVLLCFLCICVFVLFAFVILCFCVCQGEGRGGWCWANLSKLMGVWNASGSPPDEIYIRKNSQKFGRPGNIKDPGIFPSRLYTVQFESIILLNIQ